MELYNDRPTINVKCYGAVLVNSQFPEQAVTWAWEAACIKFWEEVQMKAADLFGEHAKVYAEGRSGGHLTVDRIGEESDLEKWAEFEEFVKKEMKYLSSDDYLTEQIKNNRWDEPGAEEWNFFDNKDGNSVCYVDMKAAAIKAGFGPVVRS